MVGSPGTGKTLLAKAIAGEAKVPFFSISGSDFVEMFVGVGAARVRDMFEQAKKQAPPCIIFIDEIDAVGRQRGAGLGGGNDEREQTLNQLLVEWTASRADRRDRHRRHQPPRRARPGAAASGPFRPPGRRFASRYSGPRADPACPPCARFRSRPMSTHGLARGTPGFAVPTSPTWSTKAALFAARGNKRLVGHGRLRARQGQDHDGRRAPLGGDAEEERRNTAYHESGHAVVAKLLTRPTRCTRSPSFPRGRALGVTMQLPSQDRYSQDRDRLLQTIAVLFGGRIAEEIFMNQMTTGASNDFQRATDLARRMVTQWGMSDNLGPMVYGEEDGEIFLAVR